MYENLVSLELHKSTIFTLNVPKHMNLGHTELETEWLQVRDNHYLHFLHDLFIIKCDTPNI
jgi:hypothetical protein